MSGQPLRADGKRLWSRLMEMAKIGATEAGGCNRQALTDEDKEGRELFAAWCKEAGCSYEFDEMGKCDPFDIVKHLTSDQLTDKFDKLQRAD